MLTVLDCNPEVPYSNPPPYHWIDLCSVVLNSSSSCVVNGLPPTSWDFLRSFSLITICLFIKKGQDVTYFPISWLSWL